MLRPTVLKQKGEKNMAVKSKKKKPVLSKKVLPNKLKDLKEKRILLLLLVLLFVMILGAIKLTQTTYSKPEGPSVHKNSEGEIVADDSSSASADPASATAVAAKKEEDKKKAAASTASGTSAASSGNAASSGSPSTPAPAVEEFSIGPPYGQVDESYICGEGHQFNFTADITSNGPGSITYRWLFSDGATIPGSLTFTSASTRRLTTSWTLGQQNYSGWASLEVLTPFETASKPDDANFTMEATCV